MKFNLNLLFAFSLLFVVACSSDDNDGPEDRCGPNWSPAIELEEELNNVITAGNTYAQDPTTQNCNAYKQAYLDFIEAVKDWEECYIAIGQQQEFLEAIEEAEKNVMALQC